MGCNVDFGLYAEPRALEVEWPALSVQGQGDVTGTLEREVCVVVFS